MSKQRFNRAYKEQVVLRILSGESTIGKMAEDFVHYTTVRDWVRYYKKDGINALER